MSFNTGSSGASELQVERGALGGLVDLSKAAGLAKYLKETLNQRLEIVSEKSVIATRMARMGSYEANPNDAERAVLAADFYSAALSALSKAQDTYSGLLSQAKATAFVEICSPYQVSTELMEEKLLDRRDFLFLGLALALGGVLAIVNALLWPTKQ